MLESVSQIVRLDDETVTIDIHLYCKVEILIKIMLFCLSSTCSQVVIVLWFVLTYSQLDIHMGLIGKLLEKVSQVERDEEAISQIICLSIYLSVHMIVR